MKNEKGKMKNEELGMRNGGKRGKLWQSVTVLIFTFSLFIFHLSCDNVLEQQKAGKGSFSLVVDGVGTGRTILPKTVQSDFEAYTLEFFAEGTTTNPVVSANRTNEDLSEPVFLELGTYDLYVTAYMDTAKTKPAAWGKLEGIEIGTEAVTESVTLTATIEEGTGTFSWDITFPPEVATASMTITPLGETETDEQTLPFSGEPLAAAVDSVTLNAGYYRVVFDLSNAAGNTAVHREYLHVYKNMDSLFTHDFTGTQFTIVVTNGNNDGAGSLRQAIEDVDDGGVIAIGPGVGTIALTAPLAISKSLTLDGNSVIITKAASWTTVDANSRLLTISGTDTTVNISRVHFKNGRVDGANGAVINNTGGKVSLESCIFSDNQNSACVYNTGGGTMSVKGCTFFQNGSNTISIGSNTSPLIIQGNLFYGDGHVMAVNTPFANVTSNGYNVVDRPLGASFTTQSGFNGTSTDKGNINDLSISPVSFRLLSDSPAANVITTTLPDDYPVLDFYGNPISAPAAAGAVQATVSGTGFTLTTSVSNSGYGSVSVSPPLNEDGIVSGTVTITAAPVVPYSLYYWLVNGARNDAPSLSLNIMAHTTVQAVFARFIEVTAFTDNASNVADVEGTLRYALNNAQDGDIIRFGNSTTPVAPGTTTVQLVRALPTIDKSITIEGNGITITKAASWTTVNADSQLLNINHAAAVVNISRVHFKNGASNQGAGIRKQAGTMNLESCIFSNNLVSGNSYAGGAVYASGNGTTTIKGCTFYGNSAGGYGGAIFLPASTTVTLEGNLFYGNTTGNSRSMVENRGTVTSRGYNVVDVAYGTGATSATTGFAASTINPNTDKTVEDLLTANTDSPFTDVNASTVAANVTASDLAPVSGLKVINDALPAGYPVKDFFGNDREIPWAAGAVK